MRPKRSTAFYIEALVLVVFFLAMLAVLVQMFAAARQVSRQAAQRNDAVCAARSLSECFSAADSAEEFCRLAGLEEPSGSLAVDSQGQPAPDGAYTARLAYTPGRLASLEIEIENDRGEILYSLTTEKYQD